MIILLRRHWQLAAIVTLVGVLMLACHQRDNALRAEGAMRVRLAELEAKTHRDSIAGEVAAAVVQRDTITLSKWIVKRDTLRTTLKLTDTVRIREFIAVQDSTIKSCRQSVLDFGTLCARKDSLIADYRAQLAVVKVQPSASKSQRVLWFLGGLAAGAVVDRVVK